MFKNIMFKNIKNKLNFALNLRFNLFFVNLVDIRICLTWLVCYDSFMDNIMFSEHSNIGWRYMFSKNHIFSTSDRWWTCIDHRIERCPCVLKPAELFRRGASSSLSSRQSSSSLCEGRRCWRHVFSLDSRRRSSPESRNSQRQHFG